MRLRPMLVAPAMNSAMWMHPITTTQLDTLRSWGITVVEPVVKTLACGDVGIGAMAPLVEILNKVEELLASRTASPKSSNPTSPKTHTTG